MAKLVIGANKNFGVPSIVKPASQYYVGKCVDANGKLKRVSHLIDFSNITDMDDYVMDCAYEHDSEITGTIDMSSMTTLSGNNCATDMFSYTNITGIDLSSLVNVTGPYACVKTFKGCEHLASVDLSSLETIGTCSFANTFIDCVALTSIDLPELTTVGTQGCQEAFKGCTGLTTANLPKLANLSANALSYTFSECSSLATVNLGTSIVNITADKAFYYTFSDCTSLSTINFSSLKTVSGAQSLYALFMGCTNLKTPNFSSLEALDGSECASGLFFQCGIQNYTFTSLKSLSGDAALKYAFAGCPSLTSVSFPALKTTSFGSYTTQFDSMLLGVSGCTVHFPSNLQSVIGNWTSVKNGFKGTNTTILFDLPATN